MFNKIFKILFQARWKKIGGLHGSSQPNPFQHTRPIPKPLPIVNSAIPSPIAPPPTDRTTKASFSFVMKRRNSLPPSMEVHDQPTPPPIYPSTLPPRISYRDEHRYERFKSGRGKNSHEGFRRAYGEKIRKVPRLDGPVLEPPIWSHENDPLEITEESFGKQLVVGDKWRQIPVTEKTTIVEGKKH